MRRPSILLSAAFVALALSAPARGEDGASDPVKLVRTLQFLQDSIAHGTVASDDARRKLIDLVGQRFLDADPEVWRDNRNAEAALLYVLNGGNPAVLSRLPKSEDDARRATLVAAVAAYAGGSQAEALKLWSEIALDTLPLALVGPAALVKANLLFDQNPKEALRFADIARLESPGTLVEEAAVRRGIEIAAKLGNADRFAFYATRYATRFPRSMYGTVFRQRFARSYLAVAERTGAEAAPRLDAILAPLATEDRRAIFLEVAGLALVEAKMALARTAAENAAALSVPGTAEMQRATLYRAAARAISDDPADARDELAALAGSEMAADDRALLEAVRHVVAAIERWPAVPADTPPVENEAAANPSVDTLVARAEDAIGAADAALAGARP